MAALLRAASLASLAAAPALASAPGAGTWTLHLLDPARFPLAQCLDGSYGGFYVSPGSGAMASTFVLHHQGGGWCVSLDDCLARATKPVYAGEPSIGSSTQWGEGPCRADTLSTTPPCSADGGSGGLLSLNASVNPDFHDATRVWFAYVMYHRTYHRPSTHHHRPLTLASPNPAPFAARATLTPRSATAEVLAVTC